MALPVFIEPGEQQAADVGGLTGRDIRLWFVEAPEVGIQQVAGERARRVEGELSRFSELGGESEFRVAQARPFAPSETDRRCESMVAGRWCMQQYQQVNR